jgi:hypothetical protein
MKDERNLALLDELVEEAIKLLLEDKGKNKEIVEQTRKINSTYLEIISKEKNINSQLKKKTYFFIFGLVMAALMQEESKKVNLSKDEIRSSMAGMISGCYYLISKN